MVCAGLSVCGVVEEIHRFSASLPRMLLLNCSASIRGRGKRFRDGGGRSLSRWSRWRGHLCDAMTILCAASPLLWTSEMSYDFYEMAFFKNDFHFPLLCWLWELAENIGEKLSDWLIGETRLWKFIRFNQGMSKSAASCFCLDRVWVY